jgi:branched-chain amino acid transport system permease protein
MDKSQTSPWRTALQIGIIAGIAILYMGVVGMIASFHEREVIDGVVTLGQLAIILPAFLGGTIAASRLRAVGANPLMILIGALVTGALAALPTIILLFVNTQVEDIRDVLANVNNDWVEVVTFDNRNELLTGYLILTVVTTVSAMVGGLLALLPAKLRQALSFGLGLMLLIGMFSETMDLILRQIATDDIRDALFRRGALRQGPALALFALGTIGGAIYAFTPRKPATATTTAGRSKSGQTWTQRIGYGILIGLLLALPFVIGRALSEVAVTVGIYVLMGIGLNIAIGLAGLLDLGYVTNYAVGAYVMAVLTSTGQLGIGGGTLNFWIVVPLCIVVAMFTGFVFAVPVLKMRGDYLAIATLGFGEIIGTLALSDWLRPTLGGAQGILGVPNPNFFGTDLKDPEQLYYIVLIACVITLFVSIRLNNSRIGRQWMAIREDEDVAAAMGIDTARSKLLAFTLSAATGGLAGAIFAAKVSTVFPNSFSVFVSINVLALIIVGGMGSNPGIVLGAIALVGLPELLREFSEFRWLIYGALLIFMMLNRPEGLLPSQVTQRELQKDPEPAPPPEQAAQTPATAIGD